jgi:hypothetical protein
MFRFALFHELRIESLTGFADGAPRPAVVCARAAGAISARAAKTMTMRIDISLRAERLLTNDP